MKVLYKHPQFGILFILICFSLLNFKLFLVVPCSHQKKILAVYSLLIIFKTSYRKTVYCLDYLSCECGVSL